MLETLRRIARAPFRRASVTTRLDVEATRGADAVWTSAQSFEALAREGYEQAVWAFAAIRVFTTQVKYTRPILYRGTGKSEREVEKHPLLDLLAEPNEDQSGAQLLEALAAFYLIAGNGYLERVAAGPTSRPVELWVKRPDRIKVRPDPTDRIAGYRYTNAGRSIDLDRWQILHLRTFNPLSDWYGMSPLSAAARGIDVFNAGQAHNLALMQNGARPSGAWVSEGPLDDRVRTRIREELREAAQIGRRGRTLVLEGGIDWKELGVTPKDLDFLNGQTDAARQIHSALGIHPVLTGLETGTFENQKQAMRSAVLMTVFPWLDDVFASFNRWLVPAYGDDLRLGYDRDAFPAISEDQDSLWERAETGWAKGILTRNEARAMIGYDAVDENERGEIFVSEIYAGRIPLSTTMPPAKGAPTEDGTGAAAGDPPEPATEDEGEDDAATAERLARARAAGVDRTRYRRAFHLEDEHDRAIYWRSRVDLQERWEAKATTVIRGIFEAERAMMAERFEQAETSTDLATIAATVLANTSRWDALAPVLIAATAAGGEATLDRLETEDAARARRANPPLDYQALQQIFGLVFQETVDVALAHLPKLVGDLSTVTLEQTAQKIAQGASEGLSVPGIAELIDEMYLEQVIPNRSTVIARTEIIRSSNYGSQQAAKGTGLDLTKTWLSTRDERTREPARGDRFDHVAADGQTVPIDSTYVVSGEQLRYPGDPVGSAGNVIQCFPSETLVRAANLLGAVRSWYEGPMVTIHTASGHQLAGTPNHPVLTSEGWVALGDLREGDQIVERLEARANARRGAEHEVEDVVAPIGKIYDTLYEASGAVGAAGTDVDLYGRTPKGDVDVVATSRGLLDRVKANLAQVSEDGIFEGADIRDPNRTRRGDGLDGAPRLRTPEAGSVSGGHLARALLLAHPLPLQGLGGAAAADLDAGAGQDAAHASAADAEVLGHTLRAAAGAVESDHVRSQPSVAPVGGGSAPFGGALTEVVGHSSRPFAGHVFTLLTREGWYLASDIVVQNCRCSEFYTEVKA